MSEPSTPELAWPYWSASQVLDWIVHRNVDRVWHPIYNLPDLDGWSGDPSESDEASLRSAKAELRLALMEGQVASVGMQADGTVRSIEKHYWIARSPNGLEGMFAAEYVQPPYVQILMEKASVLELWPGENRIKVGRPPEYDWDEIRKMAELEDPAKALKRNRLAGILNANLSRREPSPRQSTLRGKLKEWGWR